MNHWLIKSEPDVFSFANLRSAPGGLTPWEGVRNYQARNFLRDSMRPGDPVLFYHSSCPQPGIPGLAAIASPARPDLSALDPSSPFHDPKATPENPRWFLVDVRFEAAFPRFVSLAELRAQPSLSGLLLLRPGQRLSIQPVEPDHFTCICRLGGLSF